MEEKKAESRKKEEATILTFLKQTKEGKFSKIDERILLFPRTTQVTEDFDYEEEYYYSTR